MSDLQFDYDFQCYVRDGLIEKCGHPENYRYKSSCLACRHAGEPIAEHRRAAGYPNDRYAPPESVDPQQRYDANGKMPIFNRLVECLARFEVPADKVSEFMFMGCYAISNGKSSAYADNAVAAFKHRNTRRYVHIDAHAHVRFDRNGSWIDTCNTADEALALRRAFGISLVHVVGSSIPPEERERLEMAGYESGRRGDSVCYRSADWSNAQAAMYRKGWAEGRAAWGRKHQPRVFRDEELGGTFDGFHVTSDADPGL